MVLVDSSVWIEYFRGNAIALPVNSLLDSNRLCVNDLILAELLPSIHHKNVHRLNDLFLTITRVPLRIRWSDMVHMQTRNLQNGINKVGIPDLIIAQNAVDHDLELFTLDRHFALMSDLHGLRLFQK